MWLFLRWSGVEGKEDGGDEGAKVGEEVSEPAGRFSGSNSRSGIGGDTNGRRVIRSRTIRRSALTHGLVMPHIDATDILT